LLDFLEAVDYGDAWNGIYFRQSFQTNVRQIMLPGNFSEVTDRLDTSTNRLVFKFITTQ